MVKVKKSCIDCGKMANSLWRFRCFWCYQRTKHLMQGFTNIFINGKGGIKQNGNNRRND